MHQCGKRNEYCTIFEEDTALNARVGFAKMTILPLGSCTCLFISNFTPLLLFGVNVELSSLLSVSFNIDLMCGPWSISHVFSQEMV